MSPVLCVWGIENTIRDMARRRYIFSKESLAVWELGGREGGADLSILSCLS